MFNQGFETYFGSFKAGKRHGIGYTHYSGEESFPKRAFQRYKNGKLNGLVMWYDDQDKTTFQLSEDYEDLENQLMYLIAMKAQKVK